MQIVRLAVSLLSIGVVFGSGSVCAQDYPDKPIRLVTSAIGGGTDATARILAAGFSDAFGEQAVVENRTTLLATMAVKNAPPDGYTLLVAGSSFSIVPVLTKVPYDPVKDFAPISLLVRALHIVVVHPSLPVKSIKDLIAFAKARPGQLNYASGSLGSTTQLAADLFNSMAGVDIVRISYKGTGPALTDLMAGQVQVCFAASGGVSPHIKSGRLRALAITGAQPSALYPDLPTVAAAGLPGYELVGMTSLVAPAETPAAIIQRLSHETSRILQEVDIKQKFLSIGVEPLGNTPEEFAADIKSNMARVDKIIKGLRKK